MGKDETGTDEVRGLPGYPANNSIPSGFALPIPMASAPTDLADDPSPPTRGRRPGRTRRGTSAATPPRATTTRPRQTPLTPPTPGTPDLGQPPTPPTGPTPTSSAGSMPPTTGSSPATTTSDAATTHWADRQHDAEVADASQEEYSGWTPAGYASDDVSPTIGSTDHTAAQQAYAARPAVDPDVAAAAAEAGHDLDASCLRA